MTPNFAIDRRKLTIGTMKGKKKKELKYPYNGTGQIDPWSQRRS